MNHGTKKDKINIFFFTDESSLPIEQWSRKGASGPPHLHVCFLKGELNVCAVFPIFGFANNAK